MTKTRIPTLEHRYLAKKWKGTILIVSHDQDFLSNVCDNIIHLEALKLNYYKGDYDKFKKMHAQRMKKRMDDWNKQQAQIRAAKKSGKSKKKANEDAKKSMKRNRNKGGGRKKNRGMMDDGEEDDATMELLERPREYVMFERVMFERENITSLIHLLRGLRTHSQQYQQILSGIQVYCSECSSTSRD